MRRATIQPRLDWTRRESNIPTQDVGEPVAPTPTDGAAQHASRVERRPICHVDRLSREQVIEEIIEINPSATADFLEDFRDHRLRLYLTRLRRAGLSRGRDAVWERPADSPAIVSHERL